MRGDEHHRFKRHAEEPQLVVEWMDFADERRARKLWLHREDLSELRAAIKQHLRRINGRVERCTRSAERNIRAE